MKQAVILAAGKGVRMLPLTKHLPKPLIKICGKPYISYLLENLEKASYEKIWVVVGYKSNMIKEFLKKRGSDMEIVTVRQTKRLGTGHAVQMLRNHIKSNFVLVMGDNLYSEKDLKKINFKDDYNYVFALKHNSPKKFGVLVTKKDLLINIEEKPKKPKSNLINAGLYKFTPEIFNALKQINKSSRGEYELTSAIDLLANQRKVKVKVLQDYWIDLGKPEDVPKVERFVRSKFKQL